MSKNSLSPEEALSLVSLQLSKRITELEELTSGLDRRSFRLETSERARLVSALLVSFAQYQAFPQDSTSKEFRNLMLASANAWADTFLEGKAGVKP